MHRMNQTCSFLESIETLQSLAAFRHSLNTTQSMADFIFDLCREVIVYAESVGLESETEQLGEDQIGDSESRRLLGLVKQHKKKRLLFFNSEDGKRLRLSVQDHTLQRQPTQQYCVLCGMHRSSSREQGW